MFFPMQLGLALPHYDFSVPGENPLSWSTVADLAQRAESWGYDACYLSDHLFLDIEKYGGGPGVYETYEPVVTIAALARTVPRLRLGTLVLCEALRPAGMLAHALATLDRVCGGRLEVGIGAGWYEPEYEAIGMDLPSPGERLDRLAEALQVVTGVLGGSATTVDGRHHSVHEVVTVPPGMQRPRPRVFVGGKGDRLLRLAAELADGWNTVWAWEPDDYAARCRVLDDACSAVGRDPSTVWRSVGLYALVGEDETDLVRRYRRLQERAPGGMLSQISLAEWRRAHLVGTVDEVGNQLRVWDELGVDEFVACVGPLPFSVGDPEDVELLAAAFEAAFRVR